MQRKRRIGSIILSVAVFIGLEVASLSMLSHNGELQGLWFSRVNNNINAAVWGRIENIGSYFSLKKENIRLAEENFHLRAELAKFAVDTAGVKTSPTVIGSFIYQPATIVRHSSSGQHSYYLIDKGSEDGVTEGCGVVTGNGAVGIVDATTRHYSYVMAFMSSECVVSARLGRTGPTGSLIWDGRNTDGGVLQAIPCHIEIAPGDTVYTSGYSAIFPADIPLGVTGKSTIVNGAFYEIKVKLFEDYSKTRYVSVVGNIHADEIEELTEGR